MKALFLLPAALLALSAPVPALARQTAGDAVAPAQARPSPRETFGRFRALRAEAVQAANAGDLDLAAERLAEADTLVINHPGLILLQARVAAMRSDGPVAVALLERYGRAGLAANVGADAALQAVADTPGLADAVAAIEANAAPLGADRLSTLFTIPGDGLVESVVRDEARARWIVSMVAGRGLLAVDDEGTVSPLTLTPGFTGGLLGLAVDPRRGVLWAAMAPLPPAAHAAGPDVALPRSALLEIDLASGDVLSWREAPRDGQEHLFGDVVLAPDGVAYVSDSASGAVYRSSAEGLDEALAPGLLNSPQGLIVTPDSAALVVADYSTGLHRIDLSTGTLEPVAQPADASLIGVDGLATDGAALYALQNGTRPQRVLKLALSTDGRRIGTVEVLAANLPGIDEPTTGLVRNGELVFVSRSQWSDFGDDGALRVEDPAPAVIARLRLD